MTPPATWSWRVDSDRVAYSAGWRAILGDPPVDDVRSLHAWLGRVHPDDVATLMSSLDRHITGDTRDLRASTGCGPGTGAFRWVIAAGAAERDAAGRPTLLAGTLAT